MYPFQVMEMFKPDHTTCLTLCTCWTPSNANSYSIVRKFNSDKASKHHDD